MATFGFDILLSSILLIFIMNIFIHNLAQNKDYLINLIQLLDHFSLGESS